MDKSSLPVAQVLRDGSVESVHRGSIAVVDRDGHLRYFWGDFDFPTIMRSCAKPFQALPLIESGAADHFAFTEEEIAITTGSISGQDLQREIVEAILQKDRARRILSPVWHSQALSCPNGQKARQGGEEGWPAPEQLCGKTCGNAGDLCFQEMACRDLYGAGSSTPAVDSDKSL